MMTTVHAFDVLPEDTLRSVVDTLVRLVEAAGATVIFIGAAIAVVQFVRALPQRDPDAFVPVRLSLGRFLALGLEFQLASDVLRTALNFFLAREIAEERRIVAEREADRGTAQHA